MSRADYLNEEQLDYVRYLDSLSPEQKCKCGWYRRGECPHRECREVEAAAIRSQAK